jgi:hypothetical protein
VGTVPDSVVSAIRVGVVPGNVVSAIRVRVVTGIAVSVIRVRVVTGMLARAVRATVHIAVLGTVTGVAFIVLLMIVNGMGTHFLFSTFISIPQASEKRNPSYQRTQSGQH